MLLVNWPVVHTSPFHLVFMGVKMKGTDESKFNVSPNSGHVDKNNFQTFQLRISVH